MSLPLRTSRLLLLCLPFVVALGSAIVGYVMAGSSAMFGRWGTAMFCSKGVTLEGHPPDR